MSVPIRITLRREPEISRASIGLYGFHGETETHWFDLPWIDETEWRAIFLSLELFEEDESTWPQEIVREKSKELNLFLKDRPSTDRFKIIGQKLYEAVFGKEEIRRLLDRLLHENSEPPVIEFHISDEGSVLQAYPWELLHNGDHFLFDGRRAFAVRHVDFEEKIVSLKLESSLKVLYIAPRPIFSDHINLPVAEKLNLEEIDNRFPSHFEIASLPFNTNTRDSLQKYLLEIKDSTRKGTLVHILHIDTHGDFGWLCSCNKERLRSPGVKKCPSCGAVQSQDQKCQGYLAFEGDYKDVDWVSGKDLAKLLSGKGIQLVVLSACKSGMVGGSSTFTSMAGALVENQIPAVVAMQFSIGIKQSERFTEYFYKSMANGKSLTEAIAEARIALANSWYRPVLYLRTDSSNHLGRLFETKIALDYSEKVGVREYWIRRLGFKWDPFLYKYGESDIYLKYYFYDNMKHYHSIKGDPSRLQTVFVFGAPGSGKSSLRNVIAQHCEEEDTLPVEYYNFTSLIDKYKKNETVKIEDHIRLILKKIILQIEKIDKSKLSSSYIADSDKTIRNELWLYIDEYEDDPVNKKKIARLLNVSPESNAGSTLPADHQERLGRFCKYLTELLGYKAIYILVECDDGAVPSKEIFLKVFKPLLFTRSFLEHPACKISFKFFLSRNFRDQVKEIPWIEQSWKERCYDLDWTEKELDTLLRERLLLSSEGRRKSLFDVSGIDGLDSRVIKESLEGPRALITRCFELFEEHCRNWIPGNDETLFITKEEVEDVFKRLDNS
jgi:hypothetical protein